jgi:predicted hotdog family 3-hydroxylacyl-ACP dehydratase
MLLLDALIGAGEQTACAEATLAEGHAGIAGGRVLEAALIECVAQTVAAWKAHAAGEGPPTQGLLAGVADFRVLRHPAAGERMTIRVREDRRLGPLTLATGEIFCGDERVATGQLKLHG